jgi:transcriptional regulator with XRE-family HTH domain
VSRPAVLASPGVSKNTISRILKGESVKRVTLVALADACGVRPEWLIEGTGPMKLMKEGEKVPSGYIVHDDLVVPLKSLPNVDVDIMAECLRAVDSIFATFDKPPTAKQRVDAMLALYEKMARLKQAAADKELPGVGE